MNIEDLGDLQDGHLIYYFTISKKGFLVFPLEKRAVTEDDRFRHEPRYRKFSMFLVRLHELLM